MPSWITSTSNSGIVISTGDVAFVGTHRVKVITTVDSAVEVSYINVVISCEVGSLSTTSTAVESTSFTVGNAATTFTSSKVFTDTPACGNAQTRSFEIESTLSSGTYEALPSWITPTSDGTGIEIVTSDSNLVGTYSVR